MSERMVPVDRDVYDGFPENKRITGWTRFVDASETRPMSEEARTFADDLVELMRKHGLAEEMTAGPEPIWHAVSTLASAVVAAVDDCAPQYTRRNGIMRSFSRELVREAGIAVAYGAAADHSSETLLQRREAEENAPRP